DPRRARSGRRGRAPEAGEGRVPGVEGLVRGDRMKTGIVAVGVALLLAAPAFADDAADLAGTWKREDGRLIRLDWDEASGELQGAMLEPPENDLTHLKYEVKIRLHREGQKLVGKAIWHDTNPKTAGYPSSPDFWEADALWEFEIVAPGKIKGRSEGLSFGKGIVSDKDWDNHEYERLAVVTLG